MALKTSEMNTDLKKYRDGWDKIFKRKEEEKPVLKIFCNRCKYLKINEKEQTLIYYKTKIIVFHYCLKYNEILYHDNYHPKIIKCSKCRKEVKNENSI